MGKTHSEEDAVALMVALDAGGNRSRYDLFSDIIRQWPGVFRDLEQAMQVLQENFPRKLILEPEDRRLLEDLRAQGIATTIVTNGGSTMQRSKMRATGLDGLVEAMVVSEEFGAAKPDRAIFEEALFQIDANPLSALFVGDHPDADILGAKELGILTAWIRRDRDWPYKDQTPDYVLDWLADLREIVLG
jgi:putative hydrolase of the HAD superfamily